MVPMVVPKRPMCFGAFFGIYQNTIDNQKHPNAD